MAAAIVLFRYPFWLHYAFLIAGGIVLAMIDGFWLDTWLGKQKSRYPAWFLPAELSGIWANLFLVGMLDRPGHTLTYVWGVLSVLFLISAIRNYRAKLEEDKEEAALL